jgi:hypothetical protein
MRCPRCLGLDAFADASCERDSLKQRMYKSMSETAKRAACEATRLVLQGRYPGTMWTVVQEGETPAGQVFRIVSASERKPSGRPSHGKRRGAGSSGAANQGTVLS